MGNKDRFHVPTVMLLLSGLYMYIGNTKGEMYNGENGGLRMNHPTTLPILLKAMQKKPTEMKNTIGTSNKKPTRMKNTLL